MKTITPFKTNDVVELNLKRNFSKVLIVKISADFEVRGKLIPRKSLPKVKGDKLVLAWDHFDDPKGAAEGIGVNSSVDGWKILPVDYPASGIAAPKRPG